MNPPTAFRHKHERFSENNKIVLAIRNEGVDAISSLVHEDLSNINMAINIRNINYSLLHIAAYEGKEDVVQWLLKHGANINNTIEDGETALTLAIEEGHEGVAKILLALGASLFPTCIEDCTTDNFCSMLHTAAEGGYKNIVKLLLDYGMDVNIQELTGKTSLHVACEYGHEEIVKILLDNGADNNTLDSSNYTVLHSAAMGGNENIFKLLLNLGMDINAKAKEEESALSLACKGGHENILRILLDSGVEFNIKDHCGLTMVHCAAMGGNENVFKLILDNISNNNSFSADRELNLQPVTKQNCEKVIKKFLKSGANCYIRSPWDIHNNTLLHSAIEGGNENIVKLLLDCGMDVDAINFNGESALQRASDRERENIAKLLLVHGAKVNAKDKSDRTALHCAVSCRNENIVNLLLKYEADPNTTDAYRFSILRNAISWRGNVNIVKSLMAHGADINVRDTQGNTLLHRASESNESGNIIKTLLGLETDKNTNNSEGILNDIGLVKIPLQCGIEVDIKNNDGNTALHIASEKGNESVVKVLLDGKSDIGLTNIEKKSALHLAAGGGYEEVVKILISHGATVNAKDKRGDTPLMLCKNSSIVKLLLDCKSDIGLTNSEGKSALHLAASRGHEEIVKILASYGAQIDAKDNRGETPLMLSLKGDVVKMLVELGADIYARNNRGKSVLAKALNDFFDRLSFLRSILHCGANLSLFKSVLFSAINGTEWSAECTSDNYFVSMKGTEIEVMELLLDYGANVQSKLDRGCTILSYSVEKKDETALQFLLDYQADINIESNEKRSIVRQALYREYETCAKILTRHVVKIKSAGLHATEKILQDIDGNDELRTFKIECEKEIDKIKTSDDEIPYWKILTYNLPSWTHFARNKYIIEALGSDELKVEYPIYSSVMKNQIRRGIWRSILLDKVKLFFGAVVKAEGNEYLPMLPRLCVDEIFSYFSNRDFRNLIKVCDPSNDFNLDLCDVKI